MKRRILCFVLTLAMVLSMLVVIPATVVSADTFDASASEPTITTDADMAAFAAAVSGGTTFAGKTVKLAGDVNLTTNVGDSSHPFQGNFNGQGYTVTLSQSFSGTQKDIGGLFTLVRIPSGSTITIQNVHVAGTISVSPNAWDAANTHGGLISMLESAGSGSSNVININNCWSSVTIEETNTKRISNLAGFIAYVSHNDSYRASFTLNMDSCVWDGRIYCSGVGQQIGGFIGFTGQTKNNRYVTINISNSVAAGVIDVNNADSADVGDIIGLLNGWSSGSGWTKVSITNMLSYGYLKSGSKITYKNNLGQFNRNNNSLTTLNLTDFYYYLWDDGGKTGKIVGNDSKNGTYTNAISYTNRDESFKALNSSSFTDASKWTIEAGSIPVPKSCSDTFLTRTIGSDAQMAAFAASVNHGFTYAGLTVKLTANVNLTATVGDESHPFSGSFNGQGYTVTINQSYSGTQKNVGGLFSFVCVPLDSAATIQNVKVAGSITVQPSQTDTADYHGGLITAAGTVKAPSGTGTLNITNCWSDVDLTVNVARSNGISGFIGKIFSNGSYLTSLTVNIDSCVWTGTITGNHALGASAGFIGEMGYNRSGRTVVANIKNSVAAGRIHTTIAYSSDNGMLVGTFNNYTSGSNTLNVQNVLVTGKFTSSVTLNSDAYIDIAITKSGTGTGAINLTNLYYYSHDAGGKSPVPVVGNGSADTSTNVVGKTIPQLLALTTSSFSDSSKWTIAGELYYLCPKDFYDIFGQPEELIVDAYDLNSEFDVATAEELLAVATNVANGKDYAGKTVKLSADINMSDYSFNGIGTTSAPFAGNFNGQGHTVTINQSFSGTQANVGGLFTMVRVPGGSTVTIQNVHVAGSITVAPSSNDSADYHGGLISVVGTGSGSSATTLNITNCWSSVNFQVPNNSARANGLSGFIGKLESSTTYLAPLTVNIESCVWDGFINAGHALGASAGFIGEMGYNRSGRTVVANIKNSVAAGKISLNVAWSSDNGMLVGTFNNYTTGSNTLNVQNVLVTGKFTSSVTLNSGSYIDIAITKSSTGTGAINLTNLYYFGHNCGGKNPVPVVGNGSANTSSSVVSKTIPELAALTTSSFSDASKWQDVNGTNYLCPKGFYNVFGLPESLVPDAYDALTSFSVGTPDALLAIANAVEEGKTYSGKTINLTADIDMSSAAFNGLGTSDKPFSGNLNGQDYTVTINQSYTGTQKNTGGLIQFLAVPDAGTVTIQNVKVSGKITVAPSGTDAADTHGGLITNVRSGSSGSCELNINNCWSNVDFQINSNRVNNVGGFIGMVSHQDGYLAALTINMDSCLWDGYVNCGAAISDAGGFIGGTGLNKTGRTVTINIKNSVAAGRIALNVNWSSNVGLVIGHQQTNYSSGTGVTTVNVENMVCNGRITSSVSLSASNRFAYFIKEGTTYGALNLKNVYYIQFACGGINPIPLTPSVDGYAAPTTQTSVAAKTDTEMSNLTTSAFTTPAKWKVTANQAFILYYPCPTYFPAIAVSKISAQTAITAEARDTTNYKGIRFIGTFYNTSACHNPGTQTADFGLLVISAELYSESLDSYAKLVAAGAKVAKATKYKSENGTYVVHAVIYDIPNACKDVELVAIPYMDGYLGEVSAAVSYNSLFN